MDVYGDGRGLLVLLPWDVTSDILGRLPLHCLLRATAVCKQWKRIVSSPEFVKEYARTGGRRADSSAVDSSAVVAVVTTFGRQPSVAFSTEVQRWVRVPTLFHGAVGGRHDVVAQAKGLYLHCVSGFVYLDQPVQLVVSNPVTGASKWLPPTLAITGQGADAHLEIIEEEEAGVVGYRVILLADVPDKYHKLVEVYDSRRGCWNALPATSLFPSACGHLWHSGGVHLLGSIYMGGKSRGSTLAIFCFNVEESRWSLFLNLGAEYHIAFYNDPVVVKCDGKLVVFLVQPSLGPAADLLVVDMDRKVVVHETRVPQQRLSVFLRSGAHIPIVLGQGHHFCGCNPVDGRMAAYNIHTKRWEIWPSSPASHLYQAPPGTFWNYFRPIGLELGLMPVA